VFTSKKDAPSEAREEVKSQRSTPGPSVFHPTSANGDAPSGFRKIFFPWTTYAFSMPENETITQSALVHIFADEDFEVLILFFLSLSHFDKLTFLSFVKPLSKAPPKTKLPRFLHPHGTRRKGSAGSFSGLSAASSKDSGSKKGLSISIPTSFKDRVFPSAKYAPTST